MDYTIREMTMCDYDEAHRLWEQTEGLSLEAGDSREEVEIYLRRNRGMCFVACAGSRIVGTVLCGHDGRRGILRHLAVAEKVRGIARALIVRSLRALAAEGITRCNTFVMDDNVEGRRFWEHMGWHLLEDNYRTMQILTATEG